MANITVAEFRARFAEFRDTTAYPDSIIALYIEDTANEVDFSRFGGSGGKAQALLVAHNLALGDLAQGGGAGPVRMLASQSEGDSSESYAVPAASGNALDDLFMLTAYGQLYLALRATAVVGVTSTGKVQISVGRRGLRGPFGWAR